MLQVKGVTYRIERTEPHCYSVVRLLDDIEVGTFRTLPTLRVHSAQIELTLLRDIVRAALRSARTSAVMHVAPVFQPDEEEAASASVASSAPPGARTPSSTPPGTRTPSSTPPGARTPSSAPPPSAPAMA
jgi:hypothetical protein